MRATKYSFRFIHVLPLVAGALVSWNAAAQDAVWKCGNTFTDWPQGQTRQRCIELNRATAGFKGEARASNAEEKSVHTKPNGQSQLTRDKESRQILEAELAAVTLKRNALRESLLVRSVKSTGPATSDDLQAQTSAQELNRLDIDIESLRRELARLPVEKPSMSEKATR